MKKTVTRTNFAIKYLVESTDVFYQSERGHTVFPMMSVIGRIPVSILVLGFFPRLPPQSSSLSSGRRRRPSFEGRGSKRGRGNAHAMGPRKQQPGEEGTEGSGEQGRAMPAKLGRGC